MEQTPETKDKRRERSGRRRDTIFRIAARNQIELIAIADNKSNMIIGISVVLVSLVIAMLGSGLVIQGTPINARPDLIIPMSVLMFFSLSAAVSAILAAKPYIITGKPGSIRSLLFFQNIYNKTQDQYVEQMHKILNDKQAAYDQVIVDMYYNGVILHRKYKLLNIAYLLFMIGLVVSVLTFVITSLMF
jgi:hypothetical protein